MTQKDDETSKPKGKTNTLSIRLLNADCSAKDGLRAGHTMTEHESKEGYLYTAQSESAPPSWISIVREFSGDDLAYLKNSHCSAVLFLDVAPSDRRKRTRTFVITFGSGHHFLNPDSYVRNFGLRVTLNSVERDDLRNLDIALLDTTLIQKRIQASRRTDLRDFGIDVQSDLLRLAGGSPADKGFARALTGRDALILTAKMKPSDIIEKCRVALDLYGSKRYEENFKFIDHIIPETRPQIVQHLDREVFGALIGMVGGAASSLHIALPEVINPEHTFEIGYYGVGLKSGSKTVYPDVEIEDYVAELHAGRVEDIADMAALKSSHEVRVMAGDAGSGQYRCRLYDCFVFEMKYDRATYILFSGEWYRIDSDYYARVDANFTKYIGKSPFLKSTNSANEKELIDELNKDKDLLNLDQVKLSPANAPGANLEPCDFLSRSKQLIHLKDGHDSAPISHLWNQGLVSAECLVSDAEFRQQLLDKASARQKEQKRIGFLQLLPRKSDKPVTSAYTIVYGIMRTAYASAKKSKRLDLPFFSKVSFQSVAERIERMGFKIEVHLIEKKRK
ncbi:TIGR04141 family sporadically distributed protein [Burkholderia semiarida]|uniref:DUF6119 family protein n=1 Tax=Burkholderia TaxID=32008 RepID=UPI001CF2376C|nr:MULTISPECIES: DUF6119 family protein [Burkholderia]MCA8107481.1 TIGR04141 family sporadically distributed protein [Burkholderia sp. AU36459]MDF3118338.1 TIGR04141 family sporadically distributed protein [Burkholderia semiarida]